MKGTKLMGHLKMRDPSGGAVIFSTLLGRRPQPSHDGAKQLREFKFVFRT